MKLQEAYLKIDAYKSSNLAPGGFLKAILRNDLIGAVLKADEDSKKIIVDITQYCWDNLPHNIWGNNENVENHLYNKSKSKTQSANDLGDQDKDFQKYLKSPIDILS